MRLDRFPAEELESMSRVLRHRGPDDQGQFFSGPVALGFRRLSIVDLSGGHQPMCNEHRNVWIVFNGEIYNHAELRPRLEKLGHRFNSNSDTETIVHLYEEYGDDCVRHLCGMFAFAIWDARNNRLFCARDRLGIKPFYYTWQELVHIRVQSFLLSVISRRTKLCTRMCTSSCRVIAFLLTLP